MDISRCHGGVRFISSPRHESANISSLNGIFVLEKILEKILGKILGSSPPGYSRQGPFPRTIP